MLISFVIPAFNEAQYIESCVKSILASVAACDVDAGEVEIVVTDNNSTDDTAERAAAAGAHVVAEPVNQISRARNTGAAACSGAWLIFIDADSELNSDLLADVLRLMAAGKEAGCGSLFSMGQQPFWPRRLLSLWSWLSVRCSWAAGSFIACRRDAFEELGGFSLELFAAEEIEFSRRLKRWAKARKLGFSILTEHPLHTSDRKLHIYGAGVIVRQLVRLVIRPRSTLRNPDGLPLWYSGHREQGKVYNKK